MTAEAKDYAAGCENWGRGHQERNARNAALETWKRQENILSPKPPTG